MSELKPCANCAGEATRQAPNMHRKTCIACKECGMSTGWGTVEEVTATWNRRAQPTNEPLTLEQLREMDGEPVWVHRLEDNQGWWVVIKSTERDKVTTDYGGYFEFADYGKTWLAYRHKPKEGTL